MATVIADKYKVFGDGFSNERFVAKLTYDFSTDGSATADVVRIGSAGSKCVIVEAVAHVETAATSGGSAVVTIGVTAGDLDAFMDATAGAVAALTDDAVNKQAAGQLLVMDSGAHIQVAVATAALTAGKIHLYLAGYNVV